MTAPVAVLAVLDPRTELGVKQSAKNPNAGFVDMRDWYAYLGRADEARAAVAELIEAAGDVARIQINRRSPSNDMGKAKQLRLRAALARVGAAP
ncbi:hypothetical protein [Pseudoxanthomonas winnipegensis]|uniref:hypothetical protein n=1 Tax=Pseudoxanthomonas winnipegensis TaxID=2480810 RepID=UPI00102DF726|nr:hypothetical protein [Pseudoxanthomonas winnipegensis]RZZ85657.1 hypothetical protein EA663_11640 [Pseudoxanthomonas winnipegensis]